jgi:hypothetical protein
MANWLKNPYNQEMVYTSATGMVSNKNRHKPPKPLTLPRRFLMCSCVICPAPQSAIYGNLFLRYI